MTAGKSTGTKRSAKKPVCFVLMPFTKAVPLRGKYRQMGKPELDTVFALFKKLLAKEGYQVKRSEGKGDILRDIVLQLDGAALVLADLTGLNPNVMYELGIRHGFTKKTVLLTQDIDELPFDLRTYHAIEYGWVTGAEQATLATDLKETLRGVRDNPDTKFGPVHSHLGAKHLALEDEEKRATVRKIGALASELFHLWGAVKNVHRTLARVYPEGFTETPDGWKVHPERLDLHEQNPIWAQARVQWSPTYPAIDLFLATRYVPDRFDQFNDVSEFTKVLGSFRFTVMHSSDRSLEGFFAVRAGLDLLTDDVATLLRAVENDRYGEDMKLKCKVSLASSQDDDTQKSPGQRKGKSNPGRTKPSTATQ